MKVEHRVLDGKRALYVTVEGGKYTFIKREAAHEIQILRYDDPWWTIREGANALCSLLEELAELDFRIRGLEK